MLDPEFMEHEYQIEEPIGDFDMSNANDVEFEEDLPEGIFSLIIFIVVKSSTLCYFVLIKYE